MRTLMVLISTDFLTLGFKQALRQPRPYWVGQVKPLAEETSYGIPSSHASDSLAVWGYLAYRLKKDWLWALMILVVLLIGLSRMYLGVHFPTDVLAGWLIGLVVIIVFARSEDRVAAWLGKFSVTGQIGIGCRLHPDDPDRLDHRRADRPIPRVHRPGRVRATGADLPLRHAGQVALRCRLGYTLMRQHAAFQAKGAWWQRILRYMIGRLCWRLRPGCGLRHDRRRSNRPRPGFALYPLRRSHYLGDVRRAVGLPQGQAGGA
jgi:hypothetical protein